MSVVLKYLRVDQGSLEHALLSKASYVTHTKDPANHCIRVSEFLTNPKDSQAFVLVMPYLRKWNNPPPCTVGEALSMFAQLMEVRLK